MHFSNRVTILAMKNPSDNYPLRFVENPLISEGWTFATGRCWTNHCQSHGDRASARRWDYWAFYRCFLSVVSTCLDIATMINHVCITLGWCVLYIHAILQQCRTVDTTSIDKGACAMVCLNLNNAFHGLVHDLVINLHRPQVLWWTLAAVFLQWPYQSLCVRCWESGGWRWGSQLGGDFYI